MEGSSARVTKLDVDESDGKDEKGNDTDVVTPKKKKKRNTKEKIPKEKKPKKAKKFLEFKLGKWNPAIENVSQICLQKESDSNTINNDCCSRCTNKEVGYRFESFSLSIIININI